MKNVLCGKCQLNIPHYYVLFFSRARHRCCICHFHIACHLLTHFPKWITMTKRQHCFLANLSSSSKQILPSRNNSALFSQQTISSGSNLQWTPFSLSILQRRSWFMTGTGDWPLKPCKFPGSEARLSIHFTQLACPFKQTSCKQVRSLLKNYSNL